MVLVLSFVYPKPCTVLYTVGIDGITDKKHDFCMNVATIWTFNNGGWDEFYILYLHFLHLPVEGRKQSCGLGLR